MQRQSVMARCAKSRQTPVRSSCPPEGAAGRIGVLVVEGDAVVHVVADRLHARPAAAARRRTSTRRSRPAGRSRNSGCRADRRVASSGNSSTGVCARIGRHDVRQAGVADLEVREDASAARPARRCACRCCRSRPRSCVDGIGGSNWITCGVERSGNRDGWMESTSSFGVGCGHS